MQRFRHEIGRATVLQVWLTDTEVVGQLRVGSASRLGTGDPAQR